MKHNGLLAASLLAAFAISSFVPAHALPGC
jgi:hypothetical protein